MTEPIYEILTTMEAKYLSWLHELKAHSRACPLCWSISEESNVHRLARLD